MILPAKLKLAGKFLRCRRKGCVHVTAFDDVRRRVKTLRLDGRAYIQQRRKRLILDDNLRRRRATLLL